MKRQLINEVKQLQKIAGILKEDFDGSSAGMITTPSGTYDMADGIGLPYDDGKMAHKFKAIAKSLNMKQGSEDGDTGDFFFGYEGGDTPETADPSFISILNPTMQSNELIRKLAMQCIKQYD